MNENEDTGSSLMHCDGVQKTCVLISCAYGKRDQLKKDVDLSVGGKDATLRLDLFLLCDVTGWRPMKPLARPEATHSIPQLIAGRTCD